LPEGSDVFPGLKCHKKESDVGEKRFQKQRHYSERMHVTVTKKV
jgi:hypothetical protein